MVSEGHQSGGTSKNQNHIFGLGKYKQIYNLSCKMVFGAIDFLGKVPQGDSPQKGLQGGLSPKNGSLVICQWVKVEVYYECT